MNKIFKLFRLAFGVIALIAGQCSSVFASIDISVTCEGIRKDIGIGLGVYLSGSEISELEKIVIVKMESVDRGYSVKAQPPFLEDSEFMFYELSGSQRGIYCKNVTHCLFVVLLTEQSNPVLFSTTKPFASFAVDSWDGATHITLNCAGPTPVG